MSAIKRNRPELETCQLGVVEKSGAHLSFGGEHLGQGRERAREALLARPALMAAIRSGVEALTPARLRGGGGGSEVTEA